MLWTGWNGREGLGGLGGKVCLFTAADEAKGADWVFGLVCHGGWPHFGLEDEGTEELAAMTRAIKTLSVVEEMRNGEPIQLGVALRIVYAFTCAHSPVVDFWTARQCTVISYVRTSMKLN